KHTADRSALAVYPQLADEKTPPVGSNGKTADDQQGDGHRQIESRPDLAEVGGGQIDRDRAGRERKAAIAKGGADPLASFFYGRVGKSDDGEAGQTLGNVHLDVENTSVDSQRGSRMNAGEHEASSRCEERLESGR